MVTYKEYIRTDRIAVGQIKLAPNGVIIKQHFRMTSFGGTLTSNFNMNTP